MHFVPENGMYVYFRYNEKSTVMVILSKNKEKTILDTGRFSEVMAGYTKGVDVLKKVNLAQVKTVSVAPMAVTIIELKK